MKILYLCFVVISLVFVVKCDIDDAVLSNIKCLGTFTEMKTVITNWKVVLIVSIFCSVQSNNS